MLTLLQSSQLRCEDPACGLAGAAILTGQDHYIGIDVGTGSARACIVDSSGTIKGIASEDIKLWKPQVGYYVWPPAPSP